MNNLCALFETLFKKHFSILLFLFLFFVFLTVGLYLTFFNDCVINNYDIILGADSKRVYSYFWDIYVEHPKLNVHPFVLIGLHPILMLFNSFLHSNLASTLVLQSVLASLNGCFINKIVYNFSKNKKFALLAALIYAFSFSTLIFASIPENYIFSTFFNILLLHYILILDKKEEKFTIKEFFTLAFITIMSFGATFICVVQNLILILCLFIKKHGFKLNALYDFLKTTGVFFVLYFILLFLQKLAYVNPPLSIFKIVASEWAKYGVPEVNEKLYHVFKGSFVTGFYAIKAVGGGAYQDYSEHLVYLFNPHQNFTRFIPSLLLFVCPLLYYFKTFRENKNNKIILILFGLFLLNVFFNFIYASCECFLFAQNFLPYIIISLVLIMANCKNKFFEIGLYLFLIYQIFTNFFAIGELEKILKIGSQKHYAFLVWVLYAFITTVCLAFIVLILRKIINQEFFKLKTDKKYFISSILYFIFMLFCALFVALFHGR